MYYVIRHANNKNVIFKFNELLAGWLHYFIFGLDVSFFYRISGENKFIRMNL